MSNRKFTSASYADTASKRAALFRCAEQCEGYAPSLSPLLDRIVGLRAAFPNPADVADEAVAALVAGRSIAKLNTSAVALDKLRQSVLGRAEEALFGELSQAVYAEELAILTGLREQVSEAVETLVAAAERTSATDTSDSLLQARRADDAQLLIMVPDALKTVRSVESTRSALFGGIGRTSLGKDDRPLPYLRPTWAHGYHVPKGDVLRALRDGVGELVVPSRQDIVDMVAEVKEKRDAHTAATRGRGYSLMTSPGVAQSVVSF